MILLSKDVTRYLCNRKLNYNPLKHHKEIYITFQKRCNMSMMFLTSETNSNVKVLFNPNCAVVFWMTDQSVHIFFYKNIKTEENLSFEPKNILNMFLFSNCKESLAWRISFILIHTFGTDYLFHWGVNHPHSFSCLKRYSKWNIFDTLLQVLVVLATIFYKKYANYFLII